MEFHVLELPKLPKELKDSGDNILLWAKFINAERKEKFEIIATKDPYIASAYQKLQVISQDKQRIGSPPFEAGCQSTFINSFQKPSYTFRYALHFLHFYNCFKYVPSFLSSTRIWFTSTAICPFSLTTSSIVGLSIGICAAISFNCFL